MTNKMNLKFVKNAISLSLVSISVMMAFNAYADNSIDGIPSEPPAATSSNGSLPPVQTGTTPTYAQQMSNGSSQQIMPQNVADQSVSPQALPPLPQQDTKSPNSADLNSVLQQYTSITPNQIKGIRQKINARALAASELPVPEPKPVTGSITVSLSPGSQPPVIRPFLNNTTTFVVIDSTGQPWPVENFVVGNSDAFTVKRFDLNPEGSSFSITPNGMYSRTNLALKLKGQDTPVVINLIAGQSEMDSRVEVRVQGRGPNAMINSGTMVQGTSAQLLPILDGVAPTNSKRLKVIGDSDTTVWMKNDRFVVRTPLKIVSPASNSFVSSAEGNMNVYVISKVPQIRGIVDGKIVTLNVQGY